MLNAIGFQASGHRELYNVVLRGEKISKVMIIKTRILYIHFYTKRGKNTKTPYKHSNTVNQEKKEQEKHQ